MCLRRSPSLAVLGCPSWGSWKRMKPSRHRLSPSQGRSRAPPSRPTYRVLRRVAGKHPALDSRSVVLRSPLSPSAAWLRRGRVRRRLWMLESALLMRPMWRRLSKMPPVQPVLQLRRQLRTNRQLWLAPARVLMMMRPPVPTPLLGRPLARRPRTQPGPQWGPAPRHQILRRMEPRMPGWMAGFNVTSPRPTSGTILQPP
mmetsp:Transcript_53036/g.141052  ORF Transcript_53036/g.141052 Transcript_53036/m.141052 type:complete len:200 (+) Transcript_53036:342-941(+)